MPVCSTVFRIAGLALLLLTAGEISACEILSPNGCESDRVPGSQPTQTDDSCICCCAHIVVVQPIQLDPQVTPVPVWVELDAGVPLAHPFYIYHPPRS